MLADQRDKKLVSLQEQLEQRRRGEHYYVCTPYVYISSSVLRIYYMSISGIVNLLCCICI